MEAQKTLARSRGAAPLKPRFRTTIPIPPAPFVWRQHGPAALVLLAALLTCVLAPADYASVMSTTVMDNQNASFARWVMMLAPILLALGRRGQPWWHTWACVIFAVGFSGQVARMTFTNQVQTMPLSLLIINLAIIGYYATLFFRPSIHERAASQELALMRRDHENAELRQSVWAMQMERDRYKRLWLRAGGSEDDR